MQNFEVADINVVKSMGKPQKGNGWMLGRLEETAVRNGIVWTSAKRELNCQLNKDSEDGVQKTCIQ